MMELKRMTEEDYDIIKGRIIRDYAQSKVKVGLWQADESIELAKESIEKILTEGMKTQNHYFYDVFVKTGKIGFVWFNVHKDQLYVNYSYIYDKYINDYYEKPLLIKIEKKAKELNIKKVNLHFYGYNKLISLYRKLGYQTTEIFLKKYI